MRRLRLKALAGVLLLSVFPLSVHGIGISLEQVVGEYAPDTLLTSVPIVFYISLDNVGAGFDITGLTHGFKLHDAGTGTIWEPPTAWWNSSIPWSSYFDGGIFVSLINVDGMGADTIGFGGFRIGGPGIPDGFSDWAFAMATSFDASQEGKQFCLDSTWFPPSGVWLWSTTMGSFVPSWDGPHCWTIYQCPCIPPEISSIPPPISASHCQTMLVDFDAIEGSGGPPNFELVSGVGQIDAGTGVWTYDPSVGDIGLPLSATVRACDPFACGATVEMAVTVLNEVPSFAAGLPTNFVVETGDTIVIQMEVDDADTCTEHLFNYTASDYFTGQPVVLPGQFDSLTGILTYIGQPSDTGVYTVLMMVQEGPDEDTVQCMIYHFDSFSCGDLNHLAGTDVVDLTWLVDFLFNGGPPPVTMEAGDVDCIPGVNVADLTYLVDYLFGGGAAPCEGCEP